MTALNPIGWQPSVDDVRVGYIRSVRIEHSLLKSHGIS